MDQEEFDTLRVELLNIVADIQLGKINEDVKNKIDSRISSLNKLIDRDNNQRGSDHHLLIEACYQLYRLKDHYYRDFVL